MRLARRLVRLNSQPIFGLLPQSTSRVYRGMDCGDELKSGWEFRPRHGKQVKMVQDIIHTKVAKTTLITTHINNGTDNSCTCDTLTSFDISWCSNIAEVIHTYHINNGTNNSCSVLWGSEKHYQLKEALSVLMLCAPVFIFISGGSALLGHPRCGLSIWLSLLAISNTLFWVYAIFSREERISAISRRDRNTRDRILDLSRLIYGTIQS